MDISYKKFIFIFLFTVSVLANMVLVFMLVNNFYQINNYNQNQQVNLKILSFTNLFIEKVLMSDQDVDLDTRLTLETTVRNLNDQDIFNQWQRFTQSSNQQEASIEAKKILNLLVKKIQY